MTQCIWRNLDSCLASWHIPYVAFSQYKAVVHCVMVLQGWWPSSGYDYLLVPEHGHVGDVLLQGPGIGHGGVGAAHPRHHTGRTIDKYNSYSSFLLILIISYYLLLDIFTVCLTLNAQSEHCQSNYQKLILKILEFFLLHPVLKGCEVFHCDLYRSCCPHLIDLCGGRVLGALRLVF